MMYIGNEMIIIDFKRCLKCKNVYHKCEFPVKKLVGTEKESKIIRSRICDYCSF